MAKGPAPAWTRRDCRFDSLVTAAMKQPGVPLIYTGIEDAGRAADIRRGFYRCAAHRKVSARVSWLYQGEETSLTAQWPPDKVNGEYQLTLIVYPKTIGRRHVVTTMGTDRSQWHYNPRQRIEKEAS